MWVRIKLWCKREKEVKYKMNIINPVRNSVHISYFQYLNSARKYRGYWKKKNKYFCFRIYKITEELLKG